LAEEFSLKSGLIPLKKTVLDAKKGYSLRTFYIKNDSLKTDIKKTKNNRIKKYINDIPAYGYVKKAIDRKEIYDFESVIENKEVFKAILERQKTFEMIFNSNPLEYYSAKFALSVWNYITTVDSLFLKYIKRDLQLASKIPNTQKISIAPINTQSNSLEMGNNVSKILNFVSPSRFKFMRIFQFIIGEELKDFSYVTHNLGLYNSFFRKGELFDIELLSYIIFDKLKNIELEPEKYNNMFDKDLTFIQMLQLSIVGIDRYKIIYNYLLDNNLKYYLDVFIKTGNNAENFKNLFESKEWDSFPYLIKHGFISFMDYAILIPFLDGLMTKEDQVLMSSSLGMRSDMKPNHMEILFHKYFTNFVLDGFNETREFQLNEAQPSWKYFLLQYFFAYVSGIHYFPFNIIHKIKGDYTGSIFLNKILKNNSIYDGIFSFLKNNDYLGKSQNGTIKAFIPLKTFDTIDAVNFVKVEPLTFFFTDRPDDIEYIETDIPLNNTIKIDNSFFAFNFMSTL